MKNNKVSVLISTIGRGTLPAIILSLLSKDAKFIGEIIVLDSGEVPMAGNADFEVAIELSKALNISFVYCREVIKSIGKARWKLINMATEDNALFLDDDVLLMDNSLELMLDFFCGADYKFVVPCCYIPTDYLGIKYKTEKKFSVAEARAHCGEKDWVYPYLRYTESTHIPIRYCGTQAILFNVSSAKNDGNLLRYWKDGANREDIYFTSFLGSRLYSCRRVLTGGVLTGGLTGGVLLTGAVAWHLEHNKQYREWKNMDEEVGYSEVTAGNLHHYLTREKE